MRISSQPQCQVRYLSVSGFIEAPVEHLSCAVLLHGPSSNREYDENGEYWRLFAYIRA